jgi:PIN domain nuclease of toxin-antitoxin system
VGVTYLLDTHVLLWLLADPDRIPETVLSALADRSNSLVVSAISAFEITTKARLGKLYAGELTLTLASRVAQIGATTLPVNIEHALFAGSMPWSHRDPFDRILVAQATLDSLTLVTIDSALVSLPAPRILTW